MKTGAENFSFWKYHSFTITSGKFDGAYIRIPTFIDDNTITPEMLGLTTDEYNEYIDFYKDALCYIYGEYATKKHSKKVKLIKTHNDIRFPTWLNEYLKDVAKGNFERSFKIDQSNQLAVILGIRSISGNLTPINNSLFDIMDS